MRVVSHSCIFYCGNMFIEGLQIRPSIRKIRCKNESEVFFGKICQFLLTKLEFVIKFNLNIVLVCGILKDRNTKARMEVSHNTWIYKE